MEKTVPMTADHKALIAAWREASKNALNGDFEFLFDAGDRLADALAAPNPPLADDGSSDAALDRMAAALALALTSVSFEEPFGPDNRTWDTLSDGEKAHMRSCVRATLTAGGLSVDGAGTRPLADAVRALEASLAVLEAVGKGYRRSDEEDDWLEYPSCHSWIDHHGHRKCALVDAEVLIRETLAKINQGGGV